MTILQFILTQKLRENHYVRADVYSFINADRLLRYQGQSTMSLRPDVRLFVTRPFATEWATRWNLLINTYRRIHDRERD